MVPDMALTGWGLILVFAAIASPLWCGGLAGVGAALFLRPLKIAHGFGIGMGGLVLIAAVGLTKLVWHYDIPLPYRGFNWIFVPTPLSAVAAVVACWGVNRLMR